MATFATLGAPEKIVDALALMGYQDPTPVQEKGIPALLEGRDTILEAQTGSGKTAAFGVPAVILGSRQPGLRVLILVPTRELARQVAEEVRAIGKGSPFRAVAVTGGVNAEKEERTLFGDVRCIIATPGRLLALMEHKRVKLDQLDLVVLDEADRMLDMGFRKDIETILDATKTRKQTALVSATLPPGVVSLAAAHLREPADVRAGPRALPASLTHFRLNALADQKERALVALLRAENPERAIVFTRTRDRAASIAKMLKKLGFAADALQGDMSHEQRRHVFDLFSRGTSRILVATDIASRGLDVPEMEIVVNLDLPDEPGAYTHRAGRAARLGRPGRVVSIVLPHEKNARTELERESGGEWGPYKLNADEIAAAELPSDKPAPTRRGPAPGMPRAKNSPRAAKAPARGPPRGDGRAARPAPVRRDAAPKLNDERARMPRVKSTRPPKDDDVPASRRGRARRS